MRPASTAEITSSLSPALIAIVSASELLELFPVRFEELDPLQAPEPSSLALLQFPSGLAAVTYGKETGTVTVSLPDDDDAPRIFHEFLDEVPLGDRIQWVRDDLIKRKSENRLFDGLPSSNSSKRRTHDGSSLFTSRISDRAPKSALDVKELVETVLVDDDNEVLAGGRVIGAIVREHLLFVRDRLGEDAMTRTLAAMPAAVAREVLGALPRTWCTFESVILLDRAIARVAGKDELELMRELGRYSAQINLSTIYRAFHRDDIHEFFRHYAILHRQFQDFGKSEYQQLGPTQGRMTIRDAVCFSPLYCAMTVGYLETVIATHGGQEPHVTQSTCQCANGTVCTFELSWR